MWASDQDTSTMADKTVLLALAYHCNDRDGGNLCFPGQETIARFARCSVDTVQRALSRLEAGGYIKIEKACDSNGQRLFDRYRLMFSVTTTAPDGRTKTHAANGRESQAANCGVAAEKSPSHAQDAHRSNDEQSHAANCGVDDESHAANHAANHTAICGPNLKEPLEPKVSTPLPPRGEKADSKSSIGSEAQQPTETEAILATLAAEGVQPDVITHLLRPILVQRRFSDADRVATLAELGCKANGLEVEALAAAATSVIEAGVTTIKSARLQLAIDTAIKIGAGVVTKPADGARWHRWLEHLDRTAPAAAALARRLNVHQSRTTWPPGVKS
jgi:hypothetical protein